MNKRLRFEILRRDGFRCTYCGATPQENELHIDHVVPKALGGQDSPENLVVSCSDCNLGKASTAPNGEMVAAVDEAIAVAQAAHAALMSRVSDRVDDLAEYEGELNEIWMAHVPHPFRWDVEKWDLARISDWHAQGVPTTLISYALRLAVQSRTPWEATAAYSAAVVRNKIQEADDGSR